MKAVVGWMVAAGAAGCLLAAPAEAQQVGADSSSWNRPTPAAWRALELSVGTGYTQGFGRLSGGATSSVGDVAQAGLAGNVGLAYRMSPRWSLGADAQFQQFHSGNNPENEMSVRGQTAGLGATYHLAPYSTYDPFVSFGTGYRMLWEIHAATPDVLQHGFELGKVAIGVDLKATPEMAIGPFVGADLTYFSFERVKDIHGGAAAGTIAGGGLSSFLYAGLQAKFDFGGLREGDRPNDAPHIGLR